MRKILLYIIVIMLSICTYLSVSYAYYSVSPSTANNMASSVNVAGCLSMSVSNVISITGDKAIPVNDAKALSSDDYRVEFTVYNRCTTAQEIQVAFAPGAANTMPATALKYAMYEQGATAPTAGTTLSTDIVTLTPTVISDVAKITGDTVSTGYLMNSVITLPASSSKSYYAYLWIAKDEGGTSNSVINKVLKMHLVLGNTSSVYVAYWFDTTECTAGYPCSYGTYTGNTYTTGTGTGNEVYVKQDGSKYHVCVNDGNGHEVCLSQPYTQYGLTGHTVGSDFTSAQQTSARDVLNQLFISAGITPESCYADAGAVLCSNAFGSCEIDNDGSLYCNGLYSRCALDDTGSVFCVTF